MQNGDASSPSIIFAGLVFLVKLLITLETRGILVSDFAYLLVNIVQPLECKTVMRIHQALFWPIELF